MKAIFKNFIKSLKYFLRSERRDVNLVTKEDISMLIQRSNCRPPHRCNTFHPKASKHFRPVYQLNFFVSLRGQVKRRRKTAEWGNKDANQLVSHIPTTSRRGGSQNQTLSARQSPNMQSSRSSPTAETQGCGYPHWRELSPSQKHALTNKTHQAQQSLDGSTSPKAHAAHQAAELGPAPRSITALTWGLVHLSLESSKALTWLFCLSTDTLQKPNWGCLSALKGRRSISWHYQEQLFPIHQNEFSCECIACVIRP